MVEENAAIGPTYNVAKDKRCHQGVVERPEHGDELRYQVDRRDGPS